MLKRFCIFSITISFIMGISGVSYSMMCGSSEHSEHQQTTQSSSEHEYNAAVTAKSTAEAVNVGNKICPVSGEKIEEKTKATYEYEGKVYNFCCSMCVEDFKKDPQKYISKVEEELQASSGQGAASETGSHIHGSMDKSQTVQ